MSLIKMNYNIVFGADADWEKFKELRLEALKTDQNAYGSSYDEEILKPDSRWKEDLTRKEKPLFFIRLDGGEYIGMTGAKPVDEEEDVYMLIAVYIKKEYRGKGLAVELISNIEKDLKDRGVKEVDLIVNKEKVEAVGLYKKLGYKVVRETQEKMGDGKVYPCLFMTKQLM